MVIDTINIFVLTAFFINLGLSIFVLLRSLKSKSNSVFYFSLTGFSVSAWCLSMFLYRGVRDVESSIFWAKILYVAASFTPSTFLIFCLSFLNKKVNSLVFSITIIFNLVYSFIILFTNSVILNIAIPAFGEKVMYFGPLYFSVYTIYIPLGFISSFGALIYKYFKYKSRERTQILLMLLGSMSSSSIAMITNLILPTLGRFELNWFGQISTIIWLSAITYSIVQLRLFDIRFLLGKITYYLSLSILPYVAFYGTIWLDNFLFKSTTTTGAYILNSLVALLFVLFFNFANNFIRKSIDSNLINPGYSPLETVEELGNQLSIVFDTKDIAKTILSIISKTIRPAYENLIIIHKENELELLDYIEDRTKLDPNDLKIVLAIWLKAKPKSIVLDEIQQEMFSDYSSVYEEIKQLRDIMERLRIKVIVPMGQKDNIVGMIIVGEKEADSPYTVQDISFLESIANTARIAIERALFYEEVVDLNKNLQKKVEEATTELTTKNSELSEALSLIQESQRRERDMIDIMGHELRTPITIVRNAVSLLMSLIEKNLQVTPDILQKYTKMAYESSEREISLIETLLSATKVDSDHLQIFREDVDFLDVVNDAMLALKGRADRKGLQIVFNKPEVELPKVYADRTRIQEVMDNLLSNAIKYTEKGQVEINVASEGDFVKCSISDTGIGIPKEDLANLGKKFYRVKTHVSEDSSQIVRPGGTGLGLYVTFAIVKIHGGQVYVESEVGKGSVFSFTVPQYKDQQIEKALRTQEKDVFKRMGLKPGQGTMAEQQAKQKPTQREIAD